MYRVLAGELAVHEGIYDVAYGFMLKAAQSRDDPALYKRTVEIALQARAGASALSAARTWLANMPDSREAIQQVFGLELALQKSTDASKSLARLVKDLSPKELEAFSAALPAALSRLSNNEQRLIVVRNGLSNLLKDPARGAYAHAMLGNTALFAGQTQTALQQAQQALKQSPSNAVAATLAVALMEQGLASARPLVQTYVERPDATARVRYFYARALAEQGQTAAAIQSLKSLTHDHSDAWEAWLLLATLKADRQDWDSAHAAALAVVNGLPAKTEDSDAGHKWRNRGLLLLSEIEQKQDHFQQAQHWVDQVTQADDPLAVTYRRATLLAAQGHLDKARALIAQTEVNDATQERRRLTLEAQLLREHQAWQAAFDLLGEGFQRFPDETDWLYTQAMVAERMAHYDDMERLLRQHMGLQPEDHQALNALGYSLADRGLRLDEARGLIEKALAKAPNDPFITDSLGWVQFRQGQLEQAIATLQKAWASRADAEIAAHLGEVLWAAGRTQEARQAWAQGLVTSPDNASLRQTLQRLGVKL